MSNKIFALIDCNNFYASCERVFNPKLENKPIAILSNNDGCFISRSNEAKAIGIPMGAPFFEFEGICRSKGVQVFSSNYRLYGDMSNRVMSSLRKFSPDVEVYSIDEAFMRLDLLAIEDLEDYCNQMRIKVKQWTGIPVSIGIGPSKTLAKVANYYAKKNSLNVFDIRDKEAQEYILSRLDVGDIWGIGKKIAAKLNAIGIYKAKQFKDANAKLIRKQFGVIGEKMVYELQGIPCLDLEIIPKAKKNIVIARSFGRPLTELVAIEEALSHYAATAAVKMRRQQSKLQGICVFIVTNWYSKEQTFYRNSATFYFDLATDDTMQIASIAKKCLKKIFKADYKYKKVGIMLLDLVSNEYEQGSLLSSKTIEDKNSNVMKTIDKINNKMGKNTVFLAAQGINRDWQARALKKSPNYISDWDQLIKAL